MIELTVRLVASLAVVVGLLLLTARLGSRRFRSGADAPVKVLHRQALSRTSSIAVVEVGSRTLVLGATEHQISVLTELHDGDLPGTHSDREHADFAPELAAALEAGTVGTRSPSAAEPVPAETPATHAVTARQAGSAASGPLAGSVLSAGTWRQAMAVVRGRAR